MSERYSTSDPSLSPSLVSKEGDNDTPRRARRSRFDEPMPYVTYLLLAINALVFVAMWRMGQGDVARVATLFGDKDNTLIQSGQIWRFVTAIFLHGNQTHLLVNSLSLYMLGTQMERVYGARKYFLIYMTAGITGYLLSYARFPVTSVGASGAIFGLVGAGLVFPIRFRALVPEKPRKQILSQLFLITVINLGIGLFDRHIDNYAHVGGLLGGGAVALFLIPDVLEQRAPRRMAEALLSALVAAMVVVVGWAAIQQWTWATHGAVVAAPIYDSGGTDPWWSIRIPRTWQQVAPGQWQNSQGAIVRLIDSARDSRPVLAAVMLLRQSGRATSDRHIDGKVAWRIVGTSPQGMYDLFLVQVAAHRFMLLVLNCPANIYGNAHQDLLGMVASWRFIHPPEEPRRGR